MPRYSLRTLLILLAIGPPLVAIIGPPVAKWLKQNQLEPSTATPNANSNSYFAVYDTVGTDPVATENVLRTRLKSVRMQRDTKTGKLAVWGPTSDHIDVQAIIAIMQRDAAKDDTN